MEFSNSTDLVSRIAGNANIPVALKNYLNVLEIQGVGAAEFSHFAGRGSDRIDELVDKFKNSLSQFN